MRHVDYEALADVRYVGRKFLRFSSDLLREKAGLNTEQYEALLAIKAFPGTTLTISQLRERLQVKQHSAVNIVDRLVNKNLITREASKQDRRARHLELTAKGKTLIQELARIHYHELCQRSAEMIAALRRLKQ